ncbi:MAG: DUF1566 domain-containing protein [Pseudomonadota bacterium]
MVTRRKIIETGLKAGIALGVAGIIGQAGNVMADVWAHSPNDNRPHIQIDPWNSNGRRLVIYPDGSQRDKTTGQLIECTKISKDGRYILHNCKHAYIDRVVVDQKTGLMWGNLSKEDRNTWFEAKDLCENFKGGGYTDWRMATIQELKELYGNGAFNRACDQEIFPKNLNYSAIWSSTSSDSENAIMLYMHPKPTSSDGESSLNKKKFRVNEIALPVRTP